MSKERKVRLGRLATHIPERPDLDLTREKLATRLSSTTVLDKVSDLALREIFDACEMYHARNAQISVDPEDFKQLAKHLERVNEAWHELNVPCRRFLARSKNRGIPLDQLFLETGLLSQFLKFEPLGETNPSSQKSRQRSVWDECVFSLMSTLTADGIEVNLTDPANENSKVNDVTLFIKGVLLMANIRAHTVNDHTFVVALIRARQRKIKQ